MNRQLLQRRPCNPQSRKPFPDTALPWQHLEDLLLLEKLNTEGNEAEDTSCLEAHTLVHEKEAVAVAAEIHVQ